MDFRESPLSNAYGHAFQKGLYKGRSRLKYEWEGDTLKKMIVES